MEPQTFTGRSEEDAVANACAELGLLRNEIEYNVVDPGGKGLFGLRNKDVIIEVWKSGNKKEPEPEVADDNVGNKQEEPAEQPVLKENIKAMREGRRRGPRGGGDGSRDDDSRDDGPRRRDSRGRGSRRGDSRRGDSRRGDSRRGDSRRGDSRYGDSRRGDSRRRPRREEHEEEMVDEVMADPVEEQKLLERKAAHSLEVTQMITRAMGLEVTVETAVKDGSVVIEVRGDQADELLGRNGEILEAFQFVLHKIVNRFPGERRRLSVDIQGYRAKKEKQLWDHALKLAEKAIAVGKPITVGPMSARDRRVIHMALKEVEGVHTRSQGDGIYRRIAILPPRERGNAREPEKSDTEQVSEEEE